MTLCCTPLLRFIPCCFASHPCSFSCFADRPTPLLLVLWCSMTQRSLRWPASCCAPRQTMCGRPCRTGTSGWQVRWRGAGTGTGTGTRRRCTCWGGKAAALPAGLATRGGRGCCARRCCRSRAGSPLRCPCARLPVSPVPPALPPPTCPHTGWQALKGCCQPACAFLCSQLKLPSRTPCPRPADYAAAWEAVAKDIIYIPSKGCYLRAASATNEDRVASAQVPARACALVSACTVLLLRRPSRAACLPRVAAALFGFCAGACDAEGAPHRCCPARCAGGRQAVAGSCFTPPPRTCRPLTASPSPCAAPRLSLRACAARWRRRPSGRPSWSRRCACVCVHTDEPMLAPELARACPSLPACIHMPAACLPACLPGL